MNQKKVKLTPKQKEKLLRNIWLLHDGRWMLKSAEEFGFNAATQLNLSVQKSIAKTEIKVLLAEIGWRKVKNIETLKTVIDITLHLYTPEGHKTDVKVMGNDTMVLYTWDCYVHKMVGQAGNIGIHQCSSRVRCESWLKGMELNGEVINKLNINNCNGACENLFKIQWGRENSIKEANENEYCQY